MSSVDSIEHPHQPPSPSQGKSLLCLIKCLHPDLLKQVINLDDLLHELMHDYWDQASKQPMEEQINVN